MNIYKIVLKKPIFEFQYRFLRLNAHNIFLLLKDCFFDMVKIMINKKIKRESEKI